MDEYLKMADVFVGECKPAIRRDSVPAHRYGEPSVELYGIPAKYAAHAINSHDELVAEVERLRELLKWAVNNLQFENAFEWSDDENADAHYAALRLLGVDTEE